MNLRKTPAMAIVVFLLTSAIAQNATETPAGQPDQPQAPPAPVAQSSASGSNGFGFGTGATGTGGGGGFGANGGAGSGGGAGTSLGGSGGGVGVSDGSSAVGSGCTVGSCGGGSALGGGPPGSPIGSSDGSNGFGFGSGTEGSGGGGGFGANGGGGSGGGAGNQLGGTGGGAGASNGSLATGSGATNSSAGGGTVTGKGVTPIPLATPPPAASSQTSGAAPTAAEGQGPDSQRPPIFTNTPSQTAQAPQPSSSTAPAAPAQAPSSTPSTGNASQPSQIQPGATAGIPTTSTPAPLITVMVPVSGTERSDGTVTSTSYSGKKLYPSAVPVAAKQGDVVIVDMNKPNEKKNIKCATKELPKVVVKPTKDESKCYIKKERCCPVEYACGYDCHNKWFKVCKTQGDCEWLTQKKCYPKICVEDKCLMLGRIDGPTWTPSPAPTVRWNVVVTKSEK